MNGRVFPGNNAPTIIAAAAAAAATAATIDSVYNWPFNMTNIYNYNVWMGLTLH